ncbi:MAG: hypothetical protein JJU22_07230 [Gammaproteobacteria bacterium]|nr:hypothetical protein [Gammaproteobacteria bacterium]
MTTEALVGLIFLPLLGACATVLPGRLATRAGVLAGLLPLPWLLVVVTLAVVQDPALFVELGGFAAPLGIRLFADPLAVLMLWMVAIIGGLAAVHAWFDFPPDSPAGQSFWPLWLLLTSAMNALFLSADLFNLYVCLELVTLTAIPLIALAGSKTSVRAAMRYLLLALLASLLYLLGIALLYNATGTLDLYLIRTALTAAPPAAVVTALALISLGLLLKGAVFPLHVWLPQAHASAPGPVSAVLSALVVKTAIYLLYRLWLWSVPAGTLAAEHALMLMALLGAGALLYGGVLALLQERLKLVIAYSTVAQLGYLLLILPMAATAAWPVAWQGGLYQLLSHGLAKAAMFLAAANILHALGSDRLSHLRRLDQRQPLSLFTLAVAGVSLMGLPPSGGFLAKWLLLEAAWRSGQWWLLAVLIAGSLLAAAYIFRILAASLGRDDPTEAQPVAASRSIPVIQDAAALLLALLALGTGFAAAPILQFIEAGAPAAWSTP